jgi:hypothetical protein
MPNEAETQTGSEITAVLSLSKHVALEQTFV